MCWAEVIFGKDIRNAETIGFFFSYCAEFATIHAGVFML